MMENGWSLQRKRESNMSSNNKSVTALILAFVYLGLLDCLMIRDIANHTDQDINFIMGLPIVLFVLLIWSVL
jgi:hypothetical protein